MLKRTLAIVVSVAFTTVIFTAGTGPASAEMAPKAESTRGVSTKTDPAKKATKSGDKPGMTGADRRKKCSEEWQAAKAAGKTANQKWPQFYSACNTRLKGA